MNNPQAGARKPSVAFLLSVIFLDAMSLGLVTPILPMVVADIGGGSLGSTGLQFGGLVAAHAAMLFVAGPIWGRLSDRFGRRPMILVACAGATIDFALTAMASSLPMLFLARALAGACGGNYAMAGAYLADVSPPEKRAQMFGTLGAAFALGLIAGPAISGVLVSFDLRLPLWVACGLGALNFAVGLFVLPEGLPPGRRGIERRRSLNPLVSIRDVLLGAGVRDLAFVVFLYQLAVFGLQAVWVLFLLAKFDWPPKLIAASLVTYGLAAAAAQGGLTRIVIPRLGERSTVLLGLPISIVGLILYVAAFESWQIFAAIVFAAFGGVTNAALSSLLSKAVPPERQGELQGAVSGLAGLAAILGPAAATAVFSVFNRPAQGLEAPGAPLLLCCALLSVALIIFVATGRRSSLTAPRALDA